MRALIIARPGPVPPPPQQMVTLVDGFVAWREKYRDRMESFEFFAGAGGGCGIVNMDEAALQQMMLEYPFFPFSLLEVHPLIDGDTALRQLQQFTRSMAATA